MTTHNDDVKENYSLILELNIVTFNILSPHYIKPSWFPNIDTKYIDSEQRLKHITELIVNWMDEQKMICLQELCEEWCDKLKPIFENNNYKFHHVTYSNGKSGVSISYPNSFKTNIVEIFSCSDVVKSNLDKINELASTKDIKYLNKNIIDELHTASIIENKAIIVVIETKNNKIVLSTYHMPCKFNEKFLLTSHIHALKSKLRNIANDNLCDNVILAGDFNLSCKTLEYKFLVDVESNNNNVNIEIYNNIQFVQELKHIYNEIGVNLYESIEFKANKASGYIFNDNCADIYECIKLLSAHVTLHQKEPEHTNVSFTKNGPFIECLDFILVNQNIGVKTCQVELVTGDPHEVTYPNDICPSDHQPLMATLLIYY